MPSIRNFSIIAHIDHGKSTLADRLLEATGTVAVRDMREQIMDEMELERERGITIKAKAVRMQWKDLTLNLVDTPGHVDFTYEVSRSLAACEGALLVVDAVQGVEAQTLANAQLARDNGLVIVPIINKIDLPAADPEGVKKQIHDILAIDKTPILVSAKEGKGIPEVLAAIEREIPPPKGSSEEPLSALIFDSIYDPFRGVILYVRLFDGKLSAGMKISLVNAGTTHVIEEVGVLKLKYLPQKSLSAGEVGYLICGIKDIAQARVGDTITEPNRPTSRPHPGYIELKPFVFAGLYPVSPADYEALKKALEKLHLTDSAFQFGPETSIALGFGFRCGFLGLLHLDIVQQRLEREFSLNLLATAPNTSYRITLNDGTVKIVDNPALFPAHGTIKTIEEPYVSAQIVVPSQYVGSVMPLCQDHRGKFIDLRYITTERALLRYELPLAEIIIQFYDQLKSVSKGYASFDYEYIGFRPDDLVRLDVLVAGEPVDALSYVVHKDNAYQWGRLLTEKLKELIPRQMFEVPIQARIESRVIARETIPAARKDVLAKCYGGDITRKRKLLEKQKEGKKRMKQFGKVEIPQDAFLAVLKLKEIT